MAQERFEDIISSFGQAAELPPIEREVLWHNDVLALQEATLDDAGILEKAFDILKKAEVRRAERGYEVPVSSEELRDNPLAKIGIRKDVRYEGEGVEYERLALVFTLHEKDGKGSRDTHARTVPIAARIGNVVMPYGNFTFSEATILDGLARYTEAGKDSHAPHLEENLYAVQRVDARMMLPKVEPEHALKARHRSPDEQS